MLGHLVTFLNMGGKSSGGLSDCSLIVDEYKFIIRMKEEGKRDPDKLHIIDKFKYFHRYRDDCTSLNCHNFLELSKEIYPPSLTLTQENDSPNKASVLDMDVNIINKCFNTKVYCKTDHFQFHVISLPFLNSNLDNYLCYRVFFSQTLRFQRLCTFRSDFEERV